MKRIRIAYADERKSKWIKLVDRIILVGIFLTVGLSRILGISEFIQNQLNFSKVWADVLIVSVAIILMHIEQFVTYQIDKRIRK